MEAMRVLSEPAAAANAYDVDEHLREEGNVIVLHVGGGMAEASVLTLVDGAYEALGLEYDPFFGGQDLDRRIVDHFVGLVRNKHGKDISNDGAAMDKLRTARRSRGVRPRAPPAARRPAAGGPGELRGRRPPPGRDEEEDKGEKKIKRKK